MKKNIYLIQYIENFSPSWIMFFPVEILFPISIPCPTLVITSLQRSAFGLGAVSHA